MISFPNSKLIRKFSSITEQTVKIGDNRITEDFDFPLNDCDILFTLAYNNSTYKENIGYLITKMVFIKENKFINLDTLSKVLTLMGIKELYIFSIDEELEKSRIIIRNNGCLIRYVEILPKDFITILNWNKEKGDFLDYNRNSLYIIRDGSFLCIKNLFAYINGCQVNVGRGGSQKAHILSPLDLRLSSYLLAMTNFNYKLLNYLNDFNNLEKERYLSYMDNSYKNTTKKKFLNLNKGNESPRSIK